MTTEKSPKLTVVVNDNLEEKYYNEREQVETAPPGYHTNPMYEKLLNFRNLQEAQKKKFSVEDLFRLC